MRRSLFWLAFGGIAAAATVWGVIQNPALRERRYAALPPEQALQAAQKGDNDSFLLYLVGQRLNEAARFGEADPLLKRAAENSPGEARIRDEWAKAQTAQGNFTEAFGQLKEFAETHPQSADAHLLLGKFYLATHASDRALEEMQAAIALGSRQAEAWSALASLYSLHKNDQKSAMDAARRAVALTPDNPDARLQLASLLDRAGDPEARQHFDAALTRLTRPDQRILCAQYLLKSGKPEDATRAESELRQALKDAPDSSGASLLLGRLLTRRGTPEANNEALPLLQRTATREVGEPVAALELARLYIRLNRPEDAKKWAKEAQKRQDYVTEQKRLIGVLSQNPADRTALAALARLSARHGDAEAAVRHYALLLRLPPDAAEVLLAVAEDLSSGGLPDQARSLAARALEKTTDPALREKAARLANPPDAATH